MGTGIQDWTSGFSTTAYYQYNHAWDRVSKLIAELGQRKKIAERDNEDLSKFMFRGGSLNSNQIPFRVMSDGKRGLCAFTCMDPSKGFMNMDSIHEAKREMSDYTFRMEYFSYFPPDSEGFFRRNIIDKCRQHGEFGPIVSWRSSSLSLRGITAVMPWSKSQSQMRRQLYGIHRKYRPAHSTLG
jgi:hypothetical protein